jgi:hypothetical protein
MSVKAPYQRVAFAPSASALRPWAELRSQPLPMLLMTPIANGA